MNTIINDLMEFLQTDNVLYVICGLLAVLVIYIISR